MSIPLFEALESKRKYPRITIDQPARLRVISGETLEAVAHDISPDGLQIRCDRKAAGVVHPGGRFIKGNTGPKVEVEMELPLAAGPKQIHVLCKVYYLTGIESDVIAFGMRFQKFVGGSAQIVDDFVAQSMEPVNVRVLDYLATPRSRAEIADHIEMPPGQVDEVLSYLRDDGAIVTYAERDETRHVQSAAVMQSVLERLDSMEARLSVIEQGLKGK